MNPVKPSDDLSSYLTEFLEGSYDCMDRIILNAYFPLGQTGGGIRSWWRAWKGSNQGLSDAGMKALAGEFGRRLNAWCRQNHIPFIDFHAADDKRQIAQSHLPKDPKFRGVFAVLVRRASGPVWRVQLSPKGKILNLAHQDPWPHVQHYYFQILDPDWGHVMVRMCGYPPFGAQVALNGHEWVQRQARSHFRYKFSVWELEYSRNLLFRDGPLMDQVYQKLLDRTRGPLDLKALKTIFGVRHRQAKSKKQRPGRSEPEVSKEVQGLVALSTAPEGFTVPELAEQVRQRLNCSPEEYSSRRAAYDLAKARGKGLSERVPGRCRYQCQPRQLRTLCAYVVLREEVLKPLLAGVKTDQLHDPPKPMAPLDQQYVLLHAQMSRTFELLGLAA